MILLRDILGEEWILGVLWQRFFKTDVANIEQMNEEGLFDGQ